MTILLPALAVAFAAFCVWLTVRIVNRRERWAKWTAVGLIVVIFLYPLSWGPALWLQGSGYWPGSLIWADHAYDPIRWALDVAPDPVREGWTSYLTWFLARVEMPYYNPETGSWE